MRPLVLLLATLFVHACCTEIGCTTGLSLVLDEPIEDDGTWRIELIGEEGEDRGCTFEVVEGVVGSEACASAFFVDEDARDDAIEVPVGSVFLQVPKDAYVVRLSHDDVVVGEAEVGRLPWRRRFPNGRTCPAACETVTVELEAPEPTG